MKKIIVTVIVCLVCITHLFAFPFFGKKTVEEEEEEKTVCVIPENKEIERYLGMFLKPEQIKKGNVDFDTELLSSGDLRLMEYVSATNSADIYVIPLVRSTSGFNHLTVYVYDGGKSEKIYEALDYKSASFNVDIVLRLYGYFTKKGYSLLHFEGLVPGTSVYLDNKIPVSVDSSIMVPEGSHTLRLSSLGYTSWEDTVEYTSNTVNTLKIVLNRPTYTDLVIESFPENVEIFIDGEYAGETPLHINEYTVPLVFRAHAEGYTDRVMSVSEPKEKVLVNLKTVSMGEIDTFKEVQNKFYWSFTRTLLLFGGMAATRAVSGFNSSTQKAVNYGFYGAIGASAIEMGYRLYRYFKGVKNISP